MNSSSDKSENSGERTSNQSQKGFDLSKIPTKYWALASMAVWIGAILFFGLLRLDTYSMDEGGAMAVLLAWSVAEKVVIPVTVLGGPDFRALFFWPVALYWPGSMLAAKIFTMMAMFGGAFALYRWSRDTHGDEVALMATGLLLIAPLTILQIDAISTAPFLLAAFGLGMWLDKKYRASNHVISSLYFLQMLLVAATVTFHPMGLAYPLAMAWQWQKNPKSEKQKKQVWLGLGIATVVVIVMQLGWIALPWFSNPLVSLQQAIFSVNEMDPDSGGWMIGAVLAALLIVIAIKYKDSLLDNFMGSALLAAVVIGLVAADRSWAVIALALLLFKGFPLLIELNQKLGAKGFMGQRGLVMVGLMALAILFMRADKIHAQFIQSEILPPVDELIRTLSKEAADPDAPFIAASQWPARTMLVCRRDVLHLPPAKENGEQLLTSIKGITHIVFSHKNPKYDLLNKNLSEIASSTRTLAIQQAGVIVKIKTPEAGKEGSTAKTSPPETNDASKDSDIPVKESQTQ